MRKTILLLIFSISLTCFAQDINYTRKTLNTLTSKEFWGRGYTKNGMSKAADFIESQFKTFGLQPMNGKDFKQPFSFSVNTFPGGIELKINGKKLIPGKEFIVGQASAGVKAKADLIEKDSLNFIDDGDRIVVSLKDKLTWSVSQKVNDYTEISVIKSAINEKPKNIETTIENVFVPEFRASNICAVVKGTLKPDSVILITGHYDHLGGMGKDTYFPGANDNASGVSFLLSLAKYYAANPQKYSIAFICFAGEEAGILGSKYFTENPLIDLQKIRFLINVDMVGTGETGATVVNATQYPKEFALLNQVNDASKLLVKINPRGKAANSDHYFFTEKGVPAFFLYTQGGISAYHDVFDKPETLPFTIYENLFKLFLGFNKGLMN
ncbi:M28 family metallopeptidase [Pedobacter boryungensis]|uniref:M28 family peptidase n=1 Tax=Pedobacter boryungensis TaxID=869962 RepID=A0ABX2DBI1_9SPHI|nr:M28 family peptidase [Pedobacter boryungensis]NQX31377.1 M28 family peptidase [Pedobacter boryungensis]